MQGNNKLRVFSVNTSNYISDADLDGAVVQSGAVNGGVAASNLYNSLSLTTTLACTSLIDFVAQYNPNITFGQTTPIDTWITAVGNAIASKTSVDNIVNGTTPAANATNVTTNINGKAISTIFESNGTTVKNATNATNVNISNLNTGDNAIVNFQLGNGTAYNKTINNVENSNTVQNVDFSEEESAVFGNYTVQKYKTLWEGNLAMSTSSSEEFIDETINIPNNATLEITYHSSGGQIIGRSNDRKFIMVDEDSATTTYSATILIARGSRLISCDIGIVNNNNNFRMWRPYYILNESSTGSTVYITKIRQIL